MTKRDYKKYLQSSRWKKLSYYVKKRAGFRCQVCGGGGPLNAHHRSYKRLGMRGEENDLIAVCERCHALIHSGLHHTKHSIKLDEAVTTLLNLYHNTTGFANFLFRKALLYLGVLYYVLNGDFSKSLLYELQNFLHGKPNGNSVWRYARTFVYGSKKDLNELSVDKDFVSETLSEFLTGLEKQCRKEQK